MLVFRLLLNLLVLSVETKDNMVCSLVYGQQTHFFFTFITITLISLSVQNTLSQNKFRWLTTLEQQHSRLAPARSTAQNTAHARQNPPKEKQTIFEQNKEFHVSTSKTPRFVPGTLYFSSFYLKDLAKIFLSMRFERNSRYSVFIKNRW